MSNENEVILVVAGADKLTFFSEVRKIFLVKKIQSVVWSRKMNDYYKI